MGYTEKELVAELETASADMAVFYRQSFINYRGVTSDTNVYYTEVICEFLLRNMEKLGRIPTITREVTYKIKSHDGIPKTDGSNREEELIAMEMFRQSEIPGLGKILDYQTPLKNKRSDKAGKIDIMSYDGKTLRILELKEPDSTETMLRCVLEGDAYLRTVDVPKLLQDFDLPEDTEVVACPFVFFDGEQRKELISGRPWLKKLMAALNSKPYYIRKEQERYIVEE